MRSCNARKRALLTLCVALVTLCALGMQAAADDPTPRSVPAADPTPRAAPAADAPTPRAVPAARSYPRAFASYDALVGYAAAVARDQSALDAQLAALRAQDLATKATLDLARPSPRGGALFDERPTDRALAVAELRARIAALDASAAVLVAAGALTSDAVPWRMPTEGHITQPFGPTALWVEPAATYDGVSYAHFHEGVDIAGAWAAPVVAPERGRVVFVGPMSDGAEVVVLAHDDGLVSLYAHLDATASPPPVAAGDEVVAGQRIGTVGLTGITTGEHLHWAVWRDGTLIDPMTLVGG